MKNFDLSLYVVTDRGLMSTETLAEAVEQSVLGGATMIQLREKNADSLEFYSLAVGIKKITDKYRVPLIINDRVDIALASGADGVHIGQKDLPANVARRLIGPGKILGVSAANLGEAERAQKDGADYIGVGAMFKTGTKDDADLVTMDELRSILNKVSIPAVVIGGINNRTLPDFRGVKIAGISVVSAVISQKDITAAASELIKLVKEQKNARD